MRSRTLTFDNHLLSRHALVTDKLLYGYSVLYTSFSPYSRNIQTNKQQKIQKKHRKNT